VAPGPEQDEGQLEPFGVVGVLVHVQDVGHLPHQGRKQATTWVETTISSAVVLQKNWFRLFYK